jgi:hypothetical protein
MRPPVSMRPAEGKNNLPHFSYEILIIHMRVREYYASRENIFKGLTDKDRLGND